MNHRRSRQSALESKPGVQRSGGRKFHWPMAAILLLVAGLCGMAVWIGPIDRSDSETERQTTVSSQAINQKLESVPRRGMNTTGASDSQDLVVAADLITEIQDILRSQSPSEAELIARLEDGNLDLRPRCEAGRALARLGSATAFAAVKQALDLGLPSLRAAIAEGLGSSPLAEARQLMTLLVDDADESVVRGAIRGWARAGGEESANLLTELVYSGDRPESVRTEAALALGELADQPKAYLALTNAAWQLRDDALAPAVLEGLGRRPIIETHEFFRQYLTDPNVPSALRCAAVEALGQAEGDTSLLLLQFIRDPDPAVRAGAAWALSTTRESGQASELLVAHLQSEPDPSVRLRLYQALGNQESFDPTAVVLLVQQESRTDVRLSGLDFLGQARRDNPSALLVEFFDTIATPELKAVALESEDAQSRLAAVIALKRAPTAATTAALAEVALLSPDPVVARSAAVHPSP